jgi:hypothetical protein
MEILSQKKIQDNKGRDKGRDIRSYLWQKRFRV